MLYMKNLKTATGLQNSYSLSLRKIALLSGTFVEITQYAVQLLIVMLLGSVALYLLKALDSDEVYTTHSQTYGWFWTLAYMRGVVPASSFLLLWAGTISVCFYRIIMCSKRNSVPHESETNPEVRHENATAATAATTTISNEGVSFRTHVLPIGTAFIVNACITIAVNTLYIYSTQQALGDSLHFGIQLSLSIFRLLYIAFAFPLLSQSIHNAAMKVRFRFVLLTINNLLIPCVVTALTTDACFQVSLQHALLL